MTLRSAPSCCRTSASAPTPRWRFGLTEIAHALPVIEGVGYAEARRPIPARRCSSPARPPTTSGPTYRPAIRALFPAARFVTLKGAGHWLHADNPDGFAAIVEAFLAA